jgi:dTMP kinase
MFHLVLEGGDGVGKSTSAKFISEYLQGRGMITECHGNPGGTALGQELRTLMKNRHDLTIDDHTIQIMMMADWSCYLQTVVKPAIEAGRVVISDRANTISSMCYGLAGGMNIDEVKALREVIPTDVPPMHVIMLFSDLDTLQARQHHDVTPDGKIRECRFQKKGLEFHKRVLENYMKFIDQSRGMDCPCNPLRRLGVVNFIAVDVTPSLDVVRYKLVEAVDLILGSLRDARC